MSFLAWSLVFLMVALIAAAFGFRQVEAPSVLVAKICFGIFLLAFLVFVVLALFFEGPPIVP